MSKVLVAVLVLPCSAKVEVSRDVETVIWFFGAFCSCLPKDQVAAAEAASHAAPGLQLGRETLGMVSIGMLGISRNKTFVRQVRWNI